MLFCGVQGDYRSLILVPVFSSYDKNLSVTVVLAAFLTLGVFFTLEV